MKFPAAPESTNAEVTIHWWPSWRLTWRVNRETERGRQVVAASGPGEIPPSPDLTVSRMQRADGVVVVQQVTLATEHFLVTTGPLCGRQEGASYLHGFPSSG